MYAELNLMKKIIFMVVVNFIISQNALATEKITAKPLIKITLARNVINKICNSLTHGCGQDDANIWQIKNSKDQIYYLIDETPQLVKLQKIASDYKIIDQWYFKDYQHSQKGTGDDDLAEGGLRIFPAFYPLNKNEDAIAVLNTWFTSYSGGGRGEEVADFVQLQPKGRYRRAVKSVPFYSYEMIRACFSEKDYKNSPHCHDESGSTLSIQFKDVGKPFYQWTLNYTNFSWDAFKPEKDKSIEKSREVVMPFEKYLKSN